jgi:SNF2 family DNA or RNA helicase
MLVLDEAHRMKLGAGGAWGSACYALGPYAAHRVILTGTPAPNGRQDLENLFGFVWPGQGRTTVSRAVANRNLAEASALLKPLFTRTTKAQLNLPPVDLAYRRVFLTPLHREIYDAMVGLAVQQYPGGTRDAEALGKIVLYLLMAAVTPALLATGSSRHEPLAYRVPPLTPPRDSPLAELMRDLPSYEMSPKYAEAMALVRENAEAGRKTLVWSTFVRSLTSLERLMGRYSPAIVHGGSLDREEQLRRFREDPNCMVLLSNPATLGEGVSLHHTCHEAVYIDRDFAAGRYLQSLDRIHRLGLAPDTRTRITILVADETIDEIIQQRLDMKVNFLLRILDDPAVQELTDLDEEPTASAGMDDADLRALLTYLPSDASD